MNEFLVWLVIIIAIPLMFAFVASRPNSFSMSPEHWIWLFGSWRRRADVDGYICLVLIMLWILICVMFFLRSIFLAWL